MPKTDTRNVFEGFTNLYELSKTLRFELKPVGRTEELLKENKVFEKDKLIDDNYHKIKYYLDILHRKFISEALMDLNVDFSEYYKNFVSYQKNDEKTRKKLEDLEKKLRQTIVDKFDSKADEWKETKYKEIGLKQKGVEILFEKDNLEILKCEFKEKPTKDASYLEIVNSEGESGNLFDSFKGFTTYFGNFNNSRKNFYSAESMGTAVANRAIDENLRRFCQNKKNFDDSKAEYKKVGLTTEEKKIFEVNFYNKCLIQAGIDEYNAIIGRKADKEGQKGVNQKINEYCQKNKIKFAAFKKLDKQILSEKDVQSKIVEITSDDKVFEILKEFIKLNDGKIKAAKELIADFFSHSDKFSLEKIYIKSAALNTISSRWFSSWNTISYLFAEDKKKKTVDDNVKLPDFVSFTKLREVLEQKSDVDPKDLFKEDVLKNINVGKTHYETFLNIWQNEFKSSIEKYQKVKTAAEITIAENKIYKKNEKQNETIKDYADVAIALYQMMKYFALEKGRKSIEPKEGSDANFYNVFNEIISDWQVNVYYNEFRNYLTQKPFSEEKIKLNFENGQVLKGWDMNKEPEYFGALLKKDNEYFLAVFHKSYSNKIFRKKIKNSTIRIEEAYKIVRSDFYEKVELKQIPKLFMNLPRVCFAKSNEEEFGLTAELKNIKKEFDIFQDSKKENQNNGKKFDQNKFIKLLSYYKHCLETRKDWKVFKYNFKPLEQYKNLGEFYRDIEKETYSLETARVSCSYVEKRNNEGKIYLFQIYNKDFSAQSLGKNNLHSIYFKALFSTNNLNNKVIALAANAQVFFRNKTEKEKLKIKQDKNGKDVVDHKRYADDKILFHLPITLNFAEHDDKINRKVLNECIFNKNEKFNENLNIVGIDRGENHLAYYSVISHDGKIIDRGSFNEIDIKDKNGKVVKKVDYAKLLRDKAANRDEARKNWQTIANIKELKNGYVSQVVRKICDLILEHNAIVVFEDLNTGFKRSRGALDFPVYQKLELALVKKLNYLVNKNAKQNEAGHYLRGYQLTPIVANPKDIGKQTGIVFYTQAGYTSKTCPQCGFRKNNNKFYFESIKEAKNILKKIKSFTYDAKTKRFRLEYKTSDFWSDEEKKKNKKEQPNILFANIIRKDDFVVYSDVIRYRWHDKNTERGKNFAFGESEYADEGVKEEKKTKRGIVKRSNITECLIGLFESDEVKKHTMDYRSGDLLNQIKARELSTDFYKKLFHYLNLILEIRNSVSGADIDYIQCPACGFDSRKVKFQGFDWNGDANGAYNIARKGIMILEKIKRFKGNSANLGEMKWSDLIIGIEEWDKFTQTVNKKA